MHDRRDLQFVRICPVGWTVDDNTDGTHTRSMQAGRSGYVRVSFDMFEPD
jgi:hypothetical protein